MKLIIISAVSLDGAIGKDNGLLWHIPEDLKFFKSKTTGNYCIVGRNTYNSLPEAAKKNRHFCIVDGGETTEYPTYGEYETKGGFKKPEEAFEYLSDKGIEVAYIIGGAMLYTSTISQMDECYITWVNKTYMSADSFFPVDRLFKMFTSTDTTDWMMSTSGLKYKFSHYVK